MKKICVIGYPAKHSLSPVIHNYWLEHYGIEGSYEIREIEPDKFDNFFLNLREEGYAGCNITVPYKERAFELVDDLGDDNKNMDGVDLNNKAINTVLIKDSIYEVRNTDGDGFLLNIAKYKRTLKNGISVILGAGGAARAIIPLLVTMRIKEMIITNRNTERAEKIIEDLKHYVMIANPSIKITILPWNQRNQALSGANLLVNTTSLGMTGQPELDIDLTNLPKDALVTDIVYRSDNKNPLITNLLQAAEERGNPIVDGLGMLLYQAVPGFNMWFADELEAKGIKSAEVTPELRAKVEALL